MGMQAFRHRATGNGFFSFLFRPHPDPPHSGHAAYRPDIDGLRALAVMAVVVSHYWPEALPGGFIGVDVFFVISGFLITQILTRELTQGDFSLARFYARRARRLLPALFTVLASTFAVAYAVMLPGDMILMLKAMLATLLISANLWFWRQATSYFDATESADNPLLHLWSLGVEEQFYLFFPGVLIATFAYAVRRGHEPLSLLRRLLWPAMALGLVLAGVMTLRNSSAAFYLSPLRAWEFLAGALAALQPLRSPLSVRMRNALAALSLGVLGACASLYSAQTRFPGWSALAPVLATAVLLHTGQAGHAVARGLSMRPLVGVGLISYSFYLWHWPVLVLARHQQNLMPSPLLLPWLLALSLLLAALTWRFVEQPWRRPPAQGIRRGRSWLVASTLGLALLGVSGLVRQGFEERLPLHARTMDEARRASVPLYDCSDRPLGSACVLGERQASPEMLLWGDSHLLALAPVFDRLLADANRAGLLAANLGCAPTLALRNTNKRACEQSSGDIWTHLQANPGIRTVVLAAYWGFYFRDSGPSEAVDPQGRKLVGDAATAHALHATVSRLVDSGRLVILLGPVPTYPFNVPQVLALHTWQDKPMPAFKAADHATRSQAFWQAVQPWQNVPQVQLLDPLEWFCQTDCVLQGAGHSLYRDEQHLSPWGAQWVAHHLAQGLGLAPRPFQP